MTAIFSDSGEMKKCMDLLLDVCGFRFGDDRIKFLQSALHQRMTKLGIDSLASYNELLSHNVDEFQSLVELLTVNETYFFREPEHLKLVVERLIPEIIVNSTKKPLKIVSAGCSTGAEPYSVAMMLREKYGSKSDEMFTVTGVDIDASVIGHARQGIYGKGFFRGVDQLFVDKYFTSGSFAELRLNDEIKRQVSFEVINLLSGDFPSSMQHADVILYRNVSIYFPQHVQKIIFGKLADLLLDGGYLIVGASETIHHDIGILTLVERDGLFVYQKLPGFSVQERRSARRDETQAVLAQPAARSSASPLHRILKPSTPLLPKVGSVAVEHAKKTDPARIFIQNTDSRTSFDDALRLASAGKTKESFSILATIIHNDPSFVPAHKLIASLHINNARYDEARVAAEAALRFDQLCSVATLMLALIERHEGNNDAAYIRFREAKYLNSDCWLAYIHLAEIDFLRGDRLRARSNYAAALSILEKGLLPDRGKDFFPMIINAEQFLQLCRHKMALLSKQGL